MTKPDATTWRFHLLPLDRVQFGEERDPDRQDYYVRSRPWPQQTALLGLLRYELLLRNGLDLPVGGRWGKEEKSLVDELIGPSSFTGQEEGFGVIQELGPLAVWEKETGHLFFPCIDPGQGTAEGPIPRTGIKASYGGDILSAPRFAHYNAKEHYPDTLLLTDLGGGHKPLLDDGEYHNPKMSGGRKRMKEEKGGLLFRFTTAGVTKDYDGKLSDAEKEGHFYVTESYRMRRGYGFTFTAKLGAHELTQGPDWTERRVVRFGSDGHPWMFWGEQVTTPEAGHDSGNNFLLLTDARVKPGILDLCQAVVGDTEHFRNQRKYTAHTFSHHATHSDAEERHASLLLKRGTVLWPLDGKADAVANELNRSGRWKNIGYNHYHRFDKLIDLVKPENTSEPKQST